MQALHIRAIAGNVESRDLPPSLPSHLEGAGEALKQDTRPGRSIALAHDILVCSEID
jgi:hypothetical protein